jgi:hypothetical protein
MLIFPDESIYDGCFKNDIPDGYGRFIKQNGDIYEGDCYNLKANGKGILITHDGYKVDYLMVV